MSVLPSTDDLYVVEITADGSPRAWCMARSAAIELLWQQLPRRYWSQEGLVVRHTWPDGPLSSGHLDQVPGGLAILVAWLSRMRPGTHVFVGEAAARSWLAREIDSGRRSDAITELEQLLLL